MTSESRITEEPETIGTLAGAEVSAGMAKEIAGQTEASPQHSWLAAPNAPFIPDRPHMPEPAIAWLEARLRKTKCFLEYGAGGSTRLAASLGVPRIVSVESDAAFATAVQGIIESNGSESALDVITVDIGPTGEWGCPINFDAFRRWPNYALNAWVFMRRKKLSPDLILIDGRFRLGCFFISLLEARPGTIIMFDDYLSRPEIYGLAAHFLSPTEIIDPCAIFEVPKSLPKPGIARALARFICHPE